MEYYGYAGRILKVDLTQGSIEDEPLSKELIDGFLGGWGINNRLYYNLQKPHLDPLAPENPLIFGVGPLVGTLYPGASKIIATAKTPISTRDGRHFIDNAVAGCNRFGLMLKNAGYDHIVITGRAEKPVYLEIQDAGVELKDASELWGKLDIYQTTDYLVDRYEGAGAIAIGRGGERLVHFAMALVDYAGALGKFGLGAVMGSKGLKAIVATGARGVKVAERREFLKLTNEVRRQITSIPGFNAFHEMGVTSVWNRQAPLVTDGLWSFNDWSERFGPDKWKDVKMGPTLACGSCILSCRVGYKIAEGEFEGLTLYPSPGHFLLPARVGQRLELSDHFQAVKLYEICNRAGLCYFSTASLVNWATRLFGEGKITEEQTGGMKLKRDFETYLTLFEQIASREGFGALLADGWYPFGEKVGVDPDRFHNGTGLFKGADSIQDARFTRLDPQRFTYFTNPRPHHGGSQSLMTFLKTPIEELKRDVRNMGVSGEELDRVFTPTPHYGVLHAGRYAKHLEDILAARNCLGICIVYTIPGFGGHVTLASLAPVLAAATGLESTAEGLKRMGEKTFNLYKILNAREGFSRKDDGPSQIWLNPKKTPEGVKGLLDYFGEKEISAEDIQRLMDEYYEERGWNPERGLPTRRKLAELGLEFASEGLDLP